jgi:transposase InsO family protein
VEFIAACIQGEDNFAELCRRFGISRKTGYKWVARYEELGPEGLLARPPVARCHPQAREAALLDAVLQARKDHPFWGPKKLRRLLQEQAPQLLWPAASTIGEWLKHHGLIRPKRRRLRTPGHSGPLAPSPRPNGLWCADFKGSFLLGDRTRCHPLTITDDFSRYLLKCEALVGTDARATRLHFDRAFGEYGLPDRIRTDNGAPFASVGPGGLTTLSVWWIKLGIVPERIEPGQPQQNGRHERMHRTLKQETTRPPQADMPGQQRCFDRFRGEYNELRPHEALEQTPPARHYSVSRRLMPGVLSHPEYPDLKQRWAGNSGYISWRGQPVSLGKCLAGEPVGLKQVSESQWEVYYGPVRLGVLDDQDKEAVLHRVAKA